MCRNRGTSPCVPKPGFTLVELLVVVAIIAILIAMLMPAVQMARESARIMQCRNNLKQMGQALLSHEHAFKTFPPATLWNPTAPVAGFSTPWSMSNWATIVLPRVDQQPLYDSLDTTQSVGSAANLRFRSTRLPPMLCPSDHFNPLPFNGAKYGMGDGWARGNYAANGAQVTMDGPSGVCWTNNAFRGMMQCGVAVTAARVVDGLSNTIMLAEIRAGFDEIDPRGVWAMGDSASTIWGAGSFHWNEGGPWPGADCNGPNPANAFRMDQDNLVSCNDIWAKRGYDYPIKTELMGCYQAGSWNSQAAVRSRHRGGVNVCMADGGVQWISDYIDAQGRIARNPPVYSVWDRLMSSADGEPIPGDAF